MMHSFSILTLGCKVNQYESQQIRQLLESLGLRQTDVARQPELIVVNTCCVTHTASAKSRQLIRQAQRHEPQAIVVCGCLPTAQEDELPRIEQHLHVVKDQDDLAATLVSLVKAEAITPSQNSRHFSHRSIRPENGGKVKRKKDLCSPHRMPFVTSFPSQTRAFLKIQDGCDASCSYCIIPTARPAVRYKEPGDVLVEAAALVAAGHKEIVLTGVHIGAYGQATARRRNWPQPESPHLPDLLDRVAQVPDMARIRLSSLDPADVTPRLLDVFAARPNIMPHLHLSLQSGSDNVLRRMNRPYTADEFRAKVALAHSRLDRPAITTDIIVGFPGETDADFDQTVALAREVGFAKMHIFPFSARRGTAAARMEGKVSPQVRKARSQILRTLDYDLQSRFRAQFLGETAQVLIETTAGHATGRAERYFIVHVTHSAHKPHNNDLVTVKIEKNAPAAVLGTQAI